MLPTSRMQAPSMQIDPRHLEMMRQIQSRRALLRVNELTDKCFSSCVNDFAVTKQLRSHEEACIANCVEKFLKFSELSGDTFDAHATRR